MRKNYVLLKRYGLVLTLLLTTTIIIYSCKKDQSGVNNADLISRSKDWFQNQSNLSYLPSWDSAIVTHVDNQNFVILPSNFSLSGNSTMIKSFLVVNVSDNEIKGNLVELFNVGNNSAILENEIISNYLSFGDTSIYTKDLTYNLLVFDVEHKFIKGSSVANGEVLNKIDLKSNNDLKSKILMRGNDVGSGKLYCTDWYLVTSINGKEVDSNYMYSTCTGGASGGGGGGGGSKSNKEIKNNVKNQCIQNALNLALSKNVINDVKTLFYDAFGSNKNYNVVFADGSFNTTTKDATTSTGLDPKTSVMTSTITFNIDVSGIRSEQYAVATIYHEMVHAELRKLFPQNAEGKIVIPSQHEYMAQNFVNKIEASIKSVFPDLSDADAQALSWGGLKQTSFFDLLTDANKTLIGETLMKYSDKGRSDKLGTYCN